LIGETTFLVYTLALMVSVRVIESTSTRLQDKCAICYWNNAQSVIKEMRTRLLKDIPYILMRLKIYRWN